MPLIRKNVEYGTPLKLSSFRKVAIGTWRTVGDPSVYGTLTMDVEPALAYIEKLKEKTGLRITITHFVGKAIAEAIKRNPDLNCTLRWGRLYPRKSVDIFFQVASDKKGEDLSGMVVRGADGKTISDFAAEMDRGVKEIREKNDPAFSKMKAMMKLFPGWMSPFLVSLNSFVMYALNLWSPLLGVPRDPFGSVMITNIGSLGLDDALAPLVPYSRVPALIAVSAIRDEAIVRDGQIVAGKRLKLSGTFDHRLIDGVHASKLAQAVRKVFANPEAELGDQALLNR